MQAGKRPMAFYGAHYSLLGNLFDFAAHQTQMGVNVLLVVLVYLGEREQGDESYARRNRTKRDEISSYSEETR